MLAGARVAAHDDVEVEGFAVAVVEGEGRVARRGGGGHSVQGAAGRGAHERGDGAGVDEGEAAGSVAVEEGGDGEERVVRD